MFWQGQDSVLSLQSEILIGTGMTFLSTFDFRLADCLIYKQKKCHLRHFSQYYK